MFVPPIFLYSCIILDLKFGSASALGHYTMVNHGLNIYWRSFLFGKKYKRLQAKKISREKKEVKFFILMINVTGTCTSTLV